MNNKMDPRVQFSALAGQLVLEQVPGVNKANWEPENDTAGGAGQDRTMYLYAPKSGLPDPKQTQVLLVLRDSNCECSAESLMKDLGLDTLAEEEHFILCFPNPTDEGWNYDNDPARDNDIDYLNRCFAAMKPGKVRVSGFNGMVFYISAGKAASAMMMTMAALRPLNVSAMMIGEFPDGYSIPADALGVETAAYVCNNASAVEYLRKANGVQNREEQAGSVTEYGRNPDVLLISNDFNVDAVTVYHAWNRLFSKARRWQNDTYGNYHHRTDFADRGFQAHYNDRSLGDNGGYPHTWFEYVPPQLRGTDEKVPLLFYFHGVNCVALYGAEQCNWHDIADRENFIVVYPDPSVLKAWNLWDDPATPSDFEYVMALIEHMKKVHPIDESRIYISGFSMGSMMTQALAGAFPDVFAAGAPCNAYDFGYFNTPAKVMNIVAGADLSKYEDRSRQREMSDGKKAAYDYRMPLFHSAGLVDATIALWPVNEETSDVRMDTVRRWMEFNNTHPEQLFDPSTITGLASDEAKYLDEDERYFLQSWRSDDEGSPVYYEKLFIKRMPHAVNPVELEYAWDFIKRFRRNTDGSLTITE